MQPLSPQQYVKPFTVQSPQQQENTPYGTSGTTHVTPTRAGPHAFSRVLSGSGTQQGPAYLM